MSEDEIAELDRAVRLCTTKGTDVYWLAPDRSVFRRVLEIKQRKSEERPGTMLDCAVCEQGLILLCRYSLRDFALVTRLAD
jgi:hypothetical protein